MKQSPPRLLEPQQLAESPLDGLQIVHVSEAAAYLGAHVPDALLLEPRDLVSGAPPAPGGLPSEARLAALFARLGYRPETHFVVYDDEGGGWAGRFIWTLEMVGHQGWSYLNGGLQAWHAAGLPLASGPPPQPPVPPQTPRLALRSEPLADLEDVRRALDDPECVIWDVRSPEEYRGERSGARRAGHIPGAVNLDWMRLKDPARDWRLVEGLPDLLAEHGILPGKRVITHCQTHHRSGLSYLVGRLLGFEDIRAYPGSWAEWGNRDDTPVTVGDAPGSVGEAPGSVGEAPGSVGEAPGEGSA